jgi:hypothetical protein
VRFVVSVHRFPLDYQCTKAHNELTMMNVSNVIETDLETKCDRCGRECSAGFEERSYNVEPETGYRDIETVCARCNAEEKGLCEHCLRDDATVTLEDERLCDGCFDDAMQADDDSGEDF